MGGRARDPAAQSFDEKGRSIMKIAQMARERSTEEHLAHGLCPLEFVGESESSEDSRIGLFLMRKDRIGLGA